MVPRHAVLCPVGALRARIAGTTFVLLTCFAALGAAPPGLPSSFWGTVELEGGRTPMPDVQVYAYVDGVLCGEGSVFWHEGQAHYRVHAAADDPGTNTREGGRPGDEVRFRVGGQEMLQIGTWQGGMNTRLDLSLDKDVGHETSRVGVEPRRTVPATRVFVNAPLDAPPAAPTAVWQPTAIDGSEPELRVTGGLGPTIIAWAGGLGVLVIAGGWWRLGRQKRRSSLRGPGTCRRGRVGGTDA